MNGGKCPLGSGIRIVVYPTSERSMRRGSFPFLGQVESYVTLNRVRSIKSNPNRMGWKTAGVELSW